MKNLFKLICSLILLVSPAVSGQNPAQQEKLKAEALNFFSIYNTGDSATYREFLGNIIKDTAVLENTLMRYGNTYQMLGEVDIKDLNYTSPNDVEVMVKENKYDTWWRFHITTDDNQKFLSRTVLPVPLPESALRDKKMDEEEMKKTLDTYISEKLGPQFTGNVYIYGNDKNIYGKSFGANPAGEVNTADTEFGLASAGKMFTAIAIFQLKEKGKLELDDPVRKFLPELKNEALHDITIKQLLTHTSGMGDFFSDPRFKGMDSLNTSNSYLPFIEEDVPAFQPGSEFRYSNNGFILLGMIIEKVAGTTYQDYLQQNIFDPLHLEQTQAGTAAGGGTSTVGDMYDFLTGWKNGKLLNAQNLETMKRHIEKENYGYGTQHHILGKEHIVGHSGGYINQCVELNVYLDSDHTVVILSNSNPPFGHFISNKIKELLVWKKVAENQ